MVVELRIACPRCGQDWLRIVKIRRFAIRAIICLECEAFWEKNNPAKDSFEDYGTFMQARGVENPDDASEIEILGFALQQEDGSA